jgi:hypothetical protein
VAVVVPAAEAAAPARPLEALEEAAAPAALGPLDLLQSSTVEEDGNMAVYAVIDTSNSIVNWTIVADAEFVSQLPPSLNAVMIGADSSGDVPCAPGWTWNSGLSFSPPPEDA